MPAGAGHRSRRTRITPARIDICFAVTGIGPAAPATLSEHRDAGPGPPSPTQRRRRGGGRAAAAADPATVTVLLVDSELAAVTVAAAGSLSPVASRANPMIPPAPGPGPGPEGPSQAGHASDAT